MPANRGFGATILGTGGTSRVGHVDRAPCPGGPGHHRSRRTFTMAVSRVSEISATSPQSFEDAIRQGLERATRTLRGVTAAWIKDQRVKLENGQIAEYQVNMEVTFVLEG